MRMFAGALALLLGLTVAGCNDEVVAGGRPARLLVASGDLQTDTVGRELAQPLVVRVVDDRDRPVRGQLVNFVVTAGGGSVFAGAALTNADGEARARWTLGTVAGDTQRVEARAVSASSGTAQVFAGFRAVGLPDVPATAVIVGSASRTGAVGQGLADSLVVRVTDQHGNAVAGVAVTFAAQNGGSVSAATTTTRADGTARSQWTLGTTPGTQTATASANGSAPMTFTAQTSTGAVSRVVLLPDSIRWATLTRTQPLTVQAFDAFGNPVGGQTATIISENSAVAALDPGSIARAAGNGTTRLIATVAGSAAADTTVVTVQQYAVGIHLQAYNIYPATRPRPDSVAILMPDSAELMVWVSDSAGVRAPIANATWTSRHGRVTFGPLGVAPNGLDTRMARGVAAGLDTVDVAIGSAFASVVINVRGPLSAAQVSSGTCALDNSGAVWCWGPVYGPWAVRLAGGHTFAAVAEGGPCAVTPAGAGYCWGQNREGELGTGDTIASLSPRPVSGGHAFTRIAAGNGSACGLTSAGDLYCWGAINGTGDATPDRVANSVPRRVPGGIAFAGMTVNRQVCAWTSAGEAYCWGRNADGELGDGTKTDRAVPAPVTGGITFSRISAGSRMTCGLRTDGGAFCWGYNNEGSLGIGVYSPTSATSPVQVVGGLRFQDLSSGNGRACALTDAGVAYCWGVLELSNTGIARTASNTPAAVPGGYRFRQVAAAYDHACGVGDDGRVRCWGRNRNGALGDGSSVNSQTPVQVITY